MSDAAAGAPHPQQRPDIVGTGPSGGSDAGAAGGCWTPHVDAKIHCEKCAKSGPFLRVFPTVDLGQPGRSVTVERRPTDNGRSAVATCPWPRRDARLVAVDPTLTGAPQSAGSQHERA